VWDSSWGGTSKGGRGGGKGMSRKFSAGHDHTRDKKGGGNLLIYDPFAGGLEEPNSKQAQELLPRGELGSEN